MLRAALVVCLATALPALAAPFVPVPAPPGGKPSGLLMRVVRYDGSTNGALTIEVKNPTAKPREFGAQGLFFVPNVNPDEAPQRLGAVGGFTHGEERAETLAVAPGATEELTLDVYCIDSHRQSPSPETPFRVARNRMPPALSQTIERTTKAVAAPLGGVAAPAAKSAIQSQVWGTRGGKWIKLDGEGQQEAGK
jgi:hypothetical protein